MQRCGECKGVFPRQPWCVYRRCDSACFAMWAWPSYAQASVNANTLALGRTHQTHMASHMQQHMGSDSTMTFIIQRIIRPPNRAGRKRLLLFVLLFFFFFHSYHCPFLISSLLLCRLWPHDPNVLSSGHPQHSFLLSLSNSELISFLLVTRFSSSVCSPAASNDIIKVIYTLISAFSPLYTH